VASLWRRKKGGDQAVTHCFDLEYRGGGKRGRGRICDSRRKTNRRGGHLDPITDRGVWNADFTNRGSDLVEGGGKQERWYLLQREGESLSPASTGREVVKEE